eukprot:Skav229583  [mRNA]  locus=scaffold568:911174:912540:+ [translate_table: standard]
MQDLLHQLASLADAEDVLQHQLEAGADVNATNTMGETPLLSLLRAEASGSKQKLLKELLAARADVNLGDMMGETPLMEAACLGDHSLSLLLLQSRADLQQSTMVESGYLWIPWRAMKLTSSPSPAKQLLRDKDRAPLEPLPGCLPGTFTWDDAADPEPEPTRAEPRARPSRGPPALRRRCEENDVPLKLLGQLAAADVLKEIPGCSGSEDG